MRGGATRPGVRRGYHGPPRSAPPQRNEGLPLSVPAPIPEVRPSKPLRPPLGLPNWPAAFVAFVVLLFVPLVNLVMLVATGLWLSRRWRERGSFVGLLADALAGTALAQAFHKEGKMELVDSEIGPVLRIENTRPPVQGDASPQQGNSGTPLVLHLEILTGAWVPVRDAKSGEPMTRQVWFKPWIDQPAFLLPLAPLDLEQANQDGLAARIRVQFHDALLPGQFTASVPGGFLDRPAARPGKPGTRPGLDSDLVPEDICPVCTHTLEGEVVTCQACGASQHTKCLELTGICPGFGCD